MVIIPILQIRWGELNEKICRGVTTGPASGAALPYIYRARGSRGAVRDRFVARGVRGDLGFRVVLAVLP
jgi:hypothetical protein